MCTRARSQPARAGVWVVLLAACLLRCAPAYADVAAVAGPEGETIGFATPVVVVPHGQGLTFVNADPASYFHNLFSTKTMPKGKTAPWCGTYLPGRCPLFVTPTIAAGQTAPVQGVPALPAGQYPFICTFHGAMTGTLIVE